MPEFAPLAGWWNPQPNSGRSKYHYVADARPFSHSLCGKWMYMIGDVEPGKDDHKDNCVACKRKLLNQPSKEKS